MTPTLRRCEDPNCARYHLHCPGCGYQLSTAEYVGICMGRCGGCRQHVRFVNFDEGWELLDAREEPKP